MIAARLETTEHDVISRTLISLAPTIPQAQKSSTTFKRYGREMRPWIWSPKHAKVAAPVEEW